MDKYMAKSKVEKDAVELVAMSVDDAAVEQKKIYDLEKKKEKEEKKQIQEDNYKISASETYTTKELERRKRDLKALIDKK